MTEREIPFPVLRKQHDTQVSQVAVLGLQEQRCLYTASATGLQNSLLDDLIDFLYQKKCPGSGSIPPFCYCSTGREGIVRRIQIII